MIPLFQRTRVCTAVACLAFLVLVGPQVNAADSQSAVSSVFDGVFTAEQSARGEVQYLETCERCHKEDLLGDVHEDVLPLVGEKFLSEWSEWTVGDLFEFLTTEMPPKRKDRRNLSDQIYVDVLAYILEQNGFPAGRAELLPTIDPLLEIEMSPGE